MEKTIGAFAMRRSLGKILREVSRGDRIIVERNGEPVAAVVPIGLYKRWRREHDAFFERLHEFQDRSSLSSGDADRLAAEAVQAVRRARRGR